MRTRLAVIVSVAVLVTLPMVGEASPRGARRVPGQTRAGVPKLDVRRWSWAGLKRLKRRAGTLRSRLRLPRRSSANQRRDAVAAPPPHVRFDRREFGGGWSQLLDDVQAIGVSTGWLDEAEHEIRISYRHSARGQAEAIKKAFHETAYELDLRARDFDSDGQEEDAAQARRLRDEFRRRSGIARDKIRAIDAAGRP